MSNVILPRCPADHLPRSEHGAWLALQDHAAAQRDANREAWQEIARHVLGRALQALPYEQAS